MGRLCFHCPLPQTPEDLMKHARKALNTVFTTTYWHLGPSGHTKCNEFIWCSIVYALQIPSTPKALDQTEPHLLKHVCCSPNMLFLKIIMLNNYPAETENESSFSIQGPHPDVHLKVLLGSTWKHPRLQKNQLLVLGWCLRITGNP